MTLIKYSLAITPALNREDLGRGCQTYGPRAKTRPTREFKPARMMSFESEKIEKKLHVGDVLPNNISLIMNIF